MGNIAGNELRSFRDRYFVDSVSTELHTIDIWQADQPTVVSGDEKLWLIYIHGGAWRDPATESGGFEPAVKEIWKSSLRASIAGYASINYRLSPYPSHPKNPSFPNDPSRNVHYPSHLRDVEHALLYLEERHQISNRYLLIGHSAGATMAFELHHKCFSHKNLPVPAAILGIAGIYHLEAFIQSHSEIPVYREIIENAFPDELQWDSASPCTKQSTGSALWEHVKAIIISHSDQDELVEEKQASLMLEHARLSPTLRRKVHFLQASGKHDEIWESGTILATLIAKSLEILAVAL